MYEPKIEEMKPEELTSEHAQSLGKQTGTLIAASLFELGVAGNICEILSTMNKAGPELKKEFQEHVWLVLGQAIDDGVAGSTKRNELAHALRTAENDMRQEAWNVALHKAETGMGNTVNILEGLMRTADQCNRAAKALFSPNQRNLDGLIEEGRRLVALSEISAKVQSQKEDAVHDAECDDPDCDGHLNH